MYGYRLVTKSLLVRASWKVNQKSGVSCDKHTQPGKRKRRIVHMTDSRHNSQVDPNLVKGLQVEAPNRYRVSDLTYVRLRGSLSVPGLSPRCIFVNMHRLEPVSTDGCAVAASSSGIGEAASPSWVDPSFRQRETAP